MENKKYCPSNGTEGMMFMAKFCDQCAKEKFTHTQQDGDKKCDILTATMVHGILDDEYPKEWVYNENNVPVCTAFKKHVWRDSFTGELIEPEAEEIVDPDQLDLFKDNGFTKHYLKTESEYFREVQSGKKKFELRKNDRGFKVGDELFLIEIKDGKETGSAIHGLKITYILTGGKYGLDPEYCIINW